MEEIFSQALQLAATDPLSAIPLLNDIAFSDNPESEEAHALWQAIQRARLANDAAYTLTASGRALAAIGEWGLARDALLRSVELDPGYAEAWAYLGEAQQQNGEDGLPALLRAEELDPNSVSVRLFLALYWQRQGDYKKADQHFRLAAVHSYTDPIIHLQWGQNSVLAGDSPAALIHFQRALELAPEDPMIWKALASYSIDNEIFVAEMGLPSSQHYLLFDGDDPDALILNGRGQALVGKAETARAFFIRAIEVQPLYPPAHLYFGVFLLANGEYAQAKQELDTVISLSPDSDEAETAAYWLAQITQ